MRAILLSLSLLLAACGQSGALYFDEAPPPDQLPPSARGAKVVTTPQPVPVFTAPAAAPDAASPAATPNPEQKPADKPAAP